MRIDITLTLLFAVLSKAKADGTKPRRPREKSDSVMDVKESMTVIAVKPVS